VDREPEILACAARDTRDRGDRRTGMVIVNVLDVFAPRSSALPIAPDQRRTPGSRRPPLEEATARDAAAVLPNYSLGIAFLSWRSGSLF